MIINSSTLNILRQNIQLAFTKAYTTAPSDYIDTLATIVTSETTTEIYPMVAEIPQMREWTDDRVANDIATYDYSLTNKDYELTVKLARDYILDDKYNLWMSTVIPQIAGQAKRKPTLLVRDILRAGQATKCYDGQNFFDPSHPVNKFPGGGFSGQTQSNYSSTGRALTAANYQFVRAAMMSFKGESGEALGVYPDTLVVPPQLEDIANYITKADMIAPSATAAQANVGAVSNIYKGTAKVLVLPDLAADATTWYLMDTSKAIKPFIYQKRQDPILVSLFNPTDETVYRRKEFEFGVDLRGAAGVAVWWLAYKAVA